MLGLRSLKQCARQIIHGIPFDEDERVILGEVNVTPVAGEASAGEAPAATPPPRPKVERSKRGAAAALEATSGADANSTATAKQATDAPASETATARQAEIAKAAASAVDAEPVDAPPTEKPPITSLKDKEEVTVICEVDSFVAMDFGDAQKPKPAVKATLKGEYNGLVFDDVTAKIEGTKVTHGPAWSIQGKKKFVLLGKARINGSIAAMVKSIEDVKAEEAP
jgi:hypothetical protein